MTRPSLQPHAPPAPAPALALNTRVTWLSPPRSLAHLGPAPAAVVRAIGDKRVQIELRVKAPFARTVQSLLKWANPQDLGVREVPCLALGEEPVVNVEGFTVTGWKHPAHVRTRVMPYGIFYGRIDDQDATGPHACPEQAIGEALLQLREGGFRRRVTARCETLDGFLSRDDLADAERDALARELGALEQLLVKLDATWPQPQAQGCKA